MYIPLYNKSNYSLLSSTLTIDSIIKYALDNSLPSIAITDENLFGAMEFIKKCKQNSIKPIIGLEVKLKDYVIILFAKNYNGYKELLKVSTIQSEGLINISDISKYNNNCIAVIPFVYIDRFTEISSIFTDCYIGYKNKKEEKESLIISKNIVFFPLNLYQNPSEESILGYLYRIRDGKTILDECEYDIKDHNINKNDIYSLTTNQGLINTTLISDKCIIEFPEAKNLLPIFDCDDPKKYLFELCKAGLKKRLQSEIPDSYKDRLSYELNVINNMGFANYFLIVYDFIKFAKKNKILVGPGRGSAAGSLVAYSLGITDIDPLAYDLLFERFLNPERKTMPDIDTDFPDNKRDLVIDYVRNKYGEKRVAGIITFGTMAAKQAIRDVSRVLNIPLYKVDSLCKFIPQTSKDSLKEIYNNNETFRARIESDNALHDVFTIASQIEGFPRHTSQHAAGIVMSQIDLDEVVPLVKINNMYLTGYSMEYLEELGLLKMDFLVIKNLTLIDNILKDIETIYHKEIDFSKIPLDDKNTLKMFETANTCGIFQFESEGMKNFLRKLKPSSFEDIFAAIALFRPGAAINIDSFIRRKHGEEKVEYLDSSLEKVTKSTYGLLIYQEQIMQVASIYAGYTLGEADILRRAMSKKKLDLLKSEEEKFIKKSIENNHTVEQAKTIFDLILRFAGYGFNKSHSVVYSIVAYKMAYLKYYYPEIFFSNLLTNVIGSETKTNEYILEAKKNNLEIIKPTISHSESTYIVDKNKIIYPLSNIKSIGQVVSDQIKKAKENGPFLDIFDCFSRLYISGIKRSTFEILIYADVFKEFNLNRKTLITNLDSLYNYAELTKDIDPSLVMKPEIEIVNDYDSVFLLEKEKEVFGFYLSSHPTSLYRTDEKYCIHVNEIENYYDKTIDALILIEKIKEIVTKKGEKMAFITGSDETGSMEFIVFPKTYFGNENLSRGNVIKIRGKVEKRLNEIQVIVDKIKIIRGGNNEK